MEKRYTLPVAIALVVGTVIGSGVFFKAEAVLIEKQGIGLDIVFDHVFEREFREDVFPEVIDKFILCHGCCSISHGN